MKACIFLCNYGSSLTSLLCGTTKGATLFVAFRLFRLYSFELMRREERNCLVELLFSFVAHQFIKCLSPVGLEPGFRVLLSKVPALRK